MTQRDHNKEFQDLSEKKYAYDFDYVLRGYMMKTFEPFFREGKTLEMGCFEGEFTKLIAKRFSDLTVIEAASDLIAVAKAKVVPSVNFVHSTFEKFNATEKYENIFLVHTLEHLDNPIEVLQKVKTWLAPNGSLFLVVPNANAPSRQIAVKMGLVEHNQAVTKAEYIHGHRKTYAFDTLEAEANGAKLSIRARGGVFFKPLANFQFDRLMGTDILSQEYLDGCFALGMQYPDLCASIYLICGS